MPQVTLNIIPDSQKVRAWVRHAGVATFFGGTSLLIMVGVMLDTMRQVESHLLMRHYDGFLKKGRIRGRSTSANVALGEAASDKSVMQLVAIMVIILIIGLIAWAVRPNAL